MGNVHIFQRPPKVITLFSILAIMTPLSRKPNTVYLDTSNFDVIIGVTTLMIFKGLFVNFSSFHLCYISFNRATVLPIIENNFIINLIHWLSTFFSDQIHHSELLNMVILNLSPIRMEEGQKELSFEKGLC